MLDHINLEEINLIARAAGAAVTFRPYEGLAHCASQPELEDIRQWLAARLPPLDPHAAADSDGD